MTGPRRSATGPLASLSDLRSAGLSLLALAAVLGGSAALAQDSGATAAEPAPAEETAASPAGTADAEATGGTVVSHGYNFFGELKYGPDFEHLDYVNPDAPKGGEISQAVSGTFDSFNNYTLKGNPAAASGGNHESLMTTTADDITSLYCFICETVEYPEGIEWATFRLRPDVTFSDGTPLGAQDVKFSFDLFMEQGLESFRAAFGSMISGVEVIDPLTVRFTFAPDSSVRDRIGLAAGIPILSQAWFEETGARIDEESDVPFLGSGPYVLDSHDFGRRVVYRYDEDYWGRDLPINVGRNNFETIRLEYFADDTAAFEAFKAGEYTFRNENSSLQWATGYDFPAIEQGWMVRAELPNGNLPPAQSFVINLRRPAFQDARVREALGLMFNFEWSNETLFYDLYTRTIGFWNQSDLQAQGTPSEASWLFLQPLVEEGLLDRSILTDEVVVPPTSNPERQSDRANLRRASDLLDEAGWIVGEDGLRRKDGQTLDVVILESSPTFERVINPYVENLQRLG
jgi:microcin C transport system substrate-binding protein